MDISFIVFLGIIALVLLIFMSVIKRVLGLLALLSLITVSYAGYLMYQGLTPEQIVEHFEEKMDVIETKLSSLKEWSENSLKQVNDLHPESEEKKTLKDQ